MRADESHTHASALEHGRLEASDTPQPTVSIVVPVHGKAGLTSKCLDALLADLEPHHAEIIVVDDASRDSTAEMLAAYVRRVRVVSHDASTGFAVACNDGAAVARGEFLLFLNNDTIPTPGWLEALVRCVGENPRVGIVGAKLLFPNNTIQHAGVAISPDKLPRHIYVGFPHDHAAVNSSRRFQAVTAACALVRRDAFTELNGFDPAFHNGYEDVDLCLRMAELGLETRYCHTSVVYHYESASRDDSDSDNQKNTRLFRDRWADRLRSDELDYYLEDDLLSLSYTRCYPIHFVVSPELALVMGGGVSLHPAERLLNARSHQVFELLRENIALRVELQEAAADPARASGKDVALTASVRHPRIRSRGEVWWLSDEPSGRTVSLVLPVKNAGGHLRELLPRILEQRTDDQLEIIAIDSGSSDDTIDILHENACTVLEIDASSFNHGLTRNLGAGYAHGSVVVFMNQTALPADDRWLANLLRPLDNDPDIVGVCSRVLPRHDADYLAYFDGTRDPSASNERAVREITNPRAFEVLSHHEQRLLINFHTVSAAIRAPVLRQIPFRSVVIGEDIAWARDALEAGYKIQHEPSSVVFHGHPYSVLELFQRNVDDGLANHQLVGRTLRTDEIDPLSQHLIREDWEYLEQSRGLVGQELVEWKIEACRRRTAQVLGQWVGVQGGRWAQSVSLTERIKAGNGDSAHPRTGSRRKQ